MKDEISNEINFNLIGKNKILLIGDTIIDKYISTEFSKNSEESKSKVVKLIEENFYLGGASNVALNLYLAGANFKFITMLGNCNYSNIAQKKLSEFLDKRQILIFKNKSNQTLKERILLKNNQILRIDNDAQKINNSNNSVLKKKIVNILPQYKFLIISDYNKGFLNKDLIKFIINIANKYNIITFVDSKKEFLSLKGAHYIKPNKKELNDQMLKLKIKSQKQFINFLSKKDIFKSGILLTKGKNGMILFRKNKSTIFENGHKVNMKDVSGAGDVSIAYFCFLKSLELNDNLALKYANIAASISTTKIGTSNTLISELINEIKAKQKINIIHFDKNNRKKISLIVNKWKNLKLKIGFTNGCFDILHPGHVKFLNKANKSCDKLIIGINNDGYLKKYKGNTRPFNNINQRLKIIKKLNICNLIIIFDSKTPNSLINLIQPEIIFKGSQYNLKNIVGLEYALKYNKVIERLKMYSNYSSTRIEKIITK